MQFGVFSYFKNDLTLELALKTLNSPLDVI